MKLSIMYFQLLFLGLQKIPACVAVPWCAVSDIIGIKPILCHSSLVLANWKLKDLEKYVKLIASTGIQGILILN